MPIKELSLSRELSLLIYKFTDTLKAYFKVFNQIKSETELDLMVQNKLNQIVDTKTSTENQYNALYAWCEDSNTDEDFMVVKDAFLKRHKKYFKARNFKISKNQEKRVKEQTLVMKEIRVNVAVDCDEMDIQYKIFSTLRNELLANVNAIQQIAFKANLNDEDYQIVIAKLKSATIKLKKTIRSIPFYNALAVRHSYTCQSIKDSGQIELIANLDKSIVQYQDALKNESIFSKFFNIFSPSRWRRKAALKDYQLSVSIKSNTKEKFSAATEWLYRHTSKSKDFLSEIGRFSKGCIIPFKRSYEQYRYESMPIVNKPLQNEINRLVDENNNTVFHHNEQLKKHNGKIKALHDKTSSQCKEIEKLIACIDSIPEVGSFGYGRNNAIELEKTILNLKKVFEISEEQNDKKDIILRKLVQVKPDTSKSELASIAAETKSLSDEKKADVAHFVSDVISDTSLYGGRVVHTFMGATKATDVVNEFGSPKQKKEFNEIKKRTDTISKETFATMESDYVAKLRRALETKSLLPILSDLRVLYLKHKKLEGYFPDPQSEIEYQQRFKKEREMASGFHTRGRGELASFIDEIMSATVRGQELHRRITQQPDSLESISVDCTDTLVTMYGTDKQYKKWKLYQKTLVQPELKIQDQLTTVVCKK